MKPCLLVRKVVAREARGGPSGPTPLVLQPEPIAILAPFFTLAPVSYTVETGSQEHAAIDVGENGTLMGKVSRLQLTARRRLQPDDASFS